MKTIRIIFYILKQSANSMIKNSFMIFASICVITVSLFMLGVLSLISINLQNMLNELSTRPEIQVNCVSELSDAESKVIASKIKKNKNVESLTIISKAENMKKFLEYFKDYKELFEGYDEKFLSVTYEIKLKNPEETNKFVSEVKAMEGIESVEYSWKTISVLSKAKQWVKYGSLASLAVMGSISVLLVANTIKLTVFARKKELKIMKYIGASDSYIRGPFLIEGLFIGIIGAILAYLAIKGMYYYVEKYVNYEMINNEMKFFKVVTFSKASSKILYDFCIAGIVTGVIGSIVSIRKYIKV